MLKLLRLSWVICNGAQPQCLQTDDRVVASLTKRSPRVGSLSRDCEMAMWALDIGTGPAKGLGQVAISILPKHLSDDTGEGATARPPR
jgi:hypothetical protein